MIDSTQCQDLTSFQILICFTFFLISTARLASAHAHAHIGLACSATLRLRLHFWSNHDNRLSKEERDTRRRVFWSVVKLDRYSSAVLGLSAFIDLQAVNPAIDLTLAEAMK